MSLFCCWKLKVFNQCSTTLPIICTTLSAKIYPGNFDKFSKLLAESGYQKNCFCVFLLKVYDVVVFNIFSIHSNLYLFFFQFSILNLFKEIKV